MTASRSLNVPSILWVSPGGDAATSRSWIDCGDVCVLMCDTLVPGTPGGSYDAAASAEELSSVYRDLGSQIGYTVERREVTTWFVGIGLLLAFAAAAGSLLWSNRLLGSSPILAGPVRQPSLRGG